MKKNLSEKNTKKNRFAKVLAFLSASMKKWHFSLISILLVVFLAQLIWGILINSVKIYSLKTKISKLEKLDKMAERKNKFLREELEKYNSNSGVEALARNRLLFSKEDETLIIIKTPQKDEEF